MRLPTLLFLCALTACEGSLTGPGLPPDEAPEPELDAGPPPITLDAGALDIGSEELEVFTRGVWTPLRADCATCHADVRAFAHPDPRLGWYFALQYVRFDAPVESTLAVRSENLHCGLDACASGFGRKAVLAEGIRLWGLARQRADAGLPSFDAGVGDGGAGTPSEPDYTAFQNCQPGEDTRGSEDVARRLSKAQYVNTVLAAFNEGALLGFTSRSGVLHERAWSGSLVSAIAQLPEDGEAEKLAREDVRLTDTHLEGLLAIAQGVVDYYANQPARLGVLGGACLLDAAPTEPCVRSFISSLLGRRLLSRPLDSEEVDRWYATYTSAPGFPRERVLELMRAFLLHPELVFGLSWKGPLVAGSPRTQKLTAFEFARRLAWHYTDAPPSAQLYADAASGALLTNPAVLDAHLAGFTAGNSGGSFRFPLAAHHWTFYAFLEQWLDGASFRGFPSGGLAAAAFPGFNFQAGNENWYGEARDELYSFGFRQMFVDRGTFADFFTDTRGEVGAFTSRLYGTTGGLHDLGPQRPGVLSRVGFLASGEVYPNQILFGVRVMRSVLCQSLPAPDAAVLPANFRDLGARDAHPTWTTRHFVAQQTASPACQGCHARINALGATISRYDGAGAYDRHAGLERIWSTTGTPQVVGTPMLDDASRVAIDGRFHDVTGLSGLSQVLATSDEASLCLARKAFTFALRRRPTPADACFLTALSNKARTESMPAFWAELGKHPSFRMRTITPRTP